VRLASAANAATPADNSHISANRFATPGPTRSAEQNDERAMPDGGRQRRPSGLPFASSELRGRRVGRRR
jgi:hypothetical protein